MEAQNNSTMRLMAFNALRMLPNDKLIQMYENASKQSAQGKGKKFMIRYILDSGKIAVMTDESEVEDRKKEMIIKNKATTIAKILKNTTEGETIDTSGDYNTLETLRNLYTHIFEDTDENSIPIYNPRFTDRVNEFMEKANIAKDEGKPPVEVAKIIIQGYKNLFTLLPEESVSGVLRTITMCADNFRARTNKPKLSISYMSQFIDAMYQYDSDSVGHSKFNGKGKIPSFDNTETVEMSCQNVEITKSEDECPDNPLVNSHIPDIEEVPQEPVQQEATPPPNRPDPVVKIITDEVEKTNIKENVGTLMFPDTYRQIMSGELNKKSWAELRKTHNLKGRWEIFVETNPGDNPKQNKHLKYKSPHFVEPTYEGSYPYENLHVSDYPYGDIYLVQ